MEICKRCHAFKVGKCVCETREASSGVVPDYVSTIDITFDDMPWWKKDKYGWPIELTVGKPFGNFVRIILQNIRKIAGGVF